LQIQESHSDSVCEAKRSEAARYEQAQRDNSRKTGKGVVLPRFFINFPKMRPETPVLLSERGNFQAAKQFTLTNAPQKVIMSLIR
jgi:hypothetical protein